ncbi:PAS domain-containing protein [Caenimonas terrae]|uniref:histidine kinase n=1 Tax=Caenimonas terrae TaxID=696074 RepID=A0ABW0NEW3_9BURK
MRPTEPATAGEIGQLVEEMARVDERLDALLGGGVDSLTASNGKTFLLQRAQRQLHLSEASHQAAILAALPAHVALLDGRGFITAVNAAWTQFADDNGMRDPRRGVGSSYLAACDHGAAAGSSTAAQAGRGIRAVLAGQVRSFELEYTCHSPSQERWFSLRVAAMGSGRSAGAVVLHHDITLRIKTARDLASLAQATARRERMLNTALSAITDFTYIVDRRGRLLFANQSALDLWGFTLEEAIGKDGYDLGWPAETARKIHAQWASVFATGKTVNDEIEYQSPAGVNACYAYVFSAAFAADGSVDFVVGSSTDITQKRRSDLALQESFAEFRTLAAAMPQIVSMTTADREVIYLNQQWMDYTGLTLGQGLAGGWHDVIHPQDRPAVSQAHARMQGGTYSYEARLRRADGAYRWWLVRGVALTDDAGAVLKWIGTCTDIDDLKLAEVEVMRTNRELQRQRAELRVVLDLVPAMILLKDTQGTILRANERAARNIGRSVAQMEGAPVASVYPETATPGYVASDQEIIRTGQPILGVVERLTSADGAEVWTLKDKVPLHDETGAVTGILVMSVDISERKRHQDALRELNEELEGRVRRRTAELELARHDAETANAAKSEFLATMSHEIRTPMSGLLGLLELLALGDLNAQQSSTLAVARESGDALMRIIDDILDFSKIEANGMELNLVAASVPAVIKNLCRLHAQVASSKNLTLHADVSDQISPALSFDPLRLGQILNNFLNNAIKFTSSGQVDISVRVLGRRDEMEELEFVVRDTGIGMSQAQVERLFQPFVQAAAETSSRFGGTGLGLVISRRLAELMGGTVEVQSASGRGTVLTLRLAFEICGAAALARTQVADQELLQALMAGRRSAPSVTEAQADGTLLLIVDDHPTNRMVLVRQAASLGYAAEAAGDGEQGLALWRSGRFAAVITDCNMPGMNGYELATAIRASESRRDAGRIPVIACTANALPAAAEACIAAGMDDRLVKPASLSDLSAMLARWVPLSLEARPPHPAAPAASQPPAALQRRGLLDLVLLAEISGGDPVAQADMLLDFRRANEADAQALREAIGAQDFARVADFAHRIKGSCQMLGALLLGEAGGRLEAAAAAHQAGELRAAMDGFEAELGRLNGYLEMFPGIRQKRP